MTSFRSLRAVAAPAVIAMVAIISMSHAGSPAAGVPEDVFEKQRLMEMLLRDESTVVAAVFRRYPGRTLPFIDSYLEGGLAMIEKDPGAKDQALQSFKVGIRYAKIADETFGGSTFTDYASSFASWSPTERTRFREGQRLFREGMKVLATDPMAAIAKQLASLTLASGLGDTWGAAMANGALAEAYARLGDDASKTLARAAAEAAAELNRRLRLSDDEIQALMTLSAGESQGLSKLGHLQRAWSVAAGDPSVDAALRTSVATALAAEMERFGDVEGAARVRADAERLNAVDGAAPGTEKPAAGTDKKE